MKRKIMNIIAALMENPILEIEILNGLPEIHAHLPLKRIIRNYFDWGLNLTIHKSKAVGRQLTNGSYTGVLDDLQRNRAEFSLYPSPLGNDYEVVKYGPGIRSVDGIIISIAPPPRNFMIDIINSLNFIDTNTHTPTSFALTLLALLVGMYIVLRGHINISIMDYASLLYGQYFGSVYNRLNKIIASSTLIFLFFVENIILSNFSADLSVTVKPQVIDNLNDIIKFNVTPLIPGILQLEPSLRAGITEGHRNLWKYIQHIGPEKCFIRIDSGAATKLFSRIENIFMGEDVVLAATDIRDSLVAIDCMVAPVKFESIIRRGYKGHVSKVFQSEVLAYPQQKKLDKLKANILNDFHQAQIEYGFYSYLCMNAKDVYQPLPRNYTCELSCRHDKNDIQTSHPLRFACFSLTFTIFIINALIALMINIVEICAPMIRRRNYFIKSDTITCSISQSM